MIRAAIFCLAAACTMQAPVAAQAQTSEEALVGKWDCKARRGRGLAMRLLLNYNENKYFIHRANVAAGDRRGRIDASLTISGRWRIKGNVLAERLTNARMTAFTINGKDVSNTSFGRLASESVKNEIVGPDSLSNMKIKFQGPNKMRLVDGTFTANCAKR